MKMEEMEPIIAKQLMAIDGVMEYKPIPDEVGQSSVCMRDDVIPAAYLKILMKASNLQICHDADGGTVQMVGKSAAILRHIE